MLTIANKKFQSQSIKPILAPELKLQLNPNHNPLYHFQGCLYIQNKYQNPFNTNHTSYHLLSPPITANHHPPTLTMVRPSLPLTSLSTQPPNKPINHVTSQIYDPLGKKQTLGARLQGKDKHIIWQKVLVVNLAD